MECERMNGGQVLVDALADFGVKTIFTLHGGHMDSGYQAARDADMQVVDTRHEQAAGFAACGYARAKGEIGVVWVAPGGGVTNVVSAAANAKVDCVPLLIVSSGPPGVDFDRLPVNSGVDQMALMRPVTKWAVEVPHITRLADLVGQAVRRSRSGRPGPVYLQIPVDIFFGEIEVSRIERLDGSHMPLAPAPSIETASEIARLLEDAQRPVILAGGGILYSKAEAELVELAERFGVPVLTNGKARGAIPTDHPLWAKGFATLASAKAKGLVPDLAIVLGARFGIYTGGKRSAFLSGDTRTVRVDIEPAESGRVQEVEIDVVADCREALRAILHVARGFEKKKRNEWAEAFCSVGEASKAAFAASLEEKGPTVHPYRLAHEVAKLAPSGTIYCADGGESHSWMDALAASSGPGQWLGHGYVGSMGEGLPLAIGAQIAHPDKRVFCFTGDGSIGFNFAEFETLVRQNLPVIVIIANNLGWGMSANGQDLMFGKGRRMVSELGTVRYDEAAAGFGCHSEWVREPHELAPAIERSLASGLPACINVMTRPDVMHPITARFIGAYVERPNDNVVAVPFADGYLAQGA